MTATMVGVDWGMTALGINSTPQKARETVVRRERLTKRYGEHAAVSNVSFEVRWGDVFGFLGPHGSGKSTMTGTVIGPIQPPAGSVKRVELSADERDGLARVRAIVERPAIHRYLSDADNLRSLAHLRPRVSEARIGQVLAAVGMNDAAGERSVRPEIIHAVHGVTPNGSWFLLAGIAPNQSSNDGRPCTGENMSGDSWLVVLGHPDRDIISPHGQDA